MIAIVLLILGMAIGYFIGTRTTASLWADNADSKSTILYKGSNYKVYIKEGNGS